MLAAAVPVKVAAVAVSTAVAALTVSTADVEAVMLSVIAPALLVTGSVAETEVEGAAADPLSTILLLLLAACSAGEEAEVDDAVRLLAGVAACAAANSTSNFKTELLSVADQMDCSALSLSMGTAVPFASR